ncbi:hypothetical protein [Pseudomonas veronii]|uniref:hypothetical protein n=1 Tax=Pseudomonas veronii TaxID=76761 RepID=UPI000AD6AF3A|nr:hypothetical protein [Pseudomonas veronii]
MLSITDAQIESVKRRKPSELRQACEKDLFSGKDWFIATAGRILTVLEKLSIEEALNQTLEIIAHRLLVFTQCSGLMKPDTHLGENARQIEVSDDQTTPLLYS